MPRIEKKIFDPEARKLWAKALKSGKYKQGNAYLRTTTKNEYCCLGVACDLAIEAGVVPDWVVGPRCYSVALKTTLLPEAVQDWLGLTTNNGQFMTKDGRESLTDLNDKGTSFEEIASIIEAEPEGLFV